MIPELRKICWRKDRLSTPVLLDFPCGSAGKESTCNAGDLGLIPGLGRSPGEGKGYPLQYSGLENSMDSPWRHKELDTAGQLSLSHTYYKHFCTVYMCCGGAGSGVYLHTCTFQQNRFLEVGC